MSELRCYRCGHDFVGDRSRIDTRCPECGSGSFTRGAEFDLLASHAAGDLDDEWFDLSHDSKGEEDR